MKDDIRDLAIRITDKLVQMGHVPDCIDTDSDKEFEVQDMIFDILDEQKELHETNKI